ncbi:hypothetical protein Q5P01_013581 [Channa striata]|uniref:Claudin n=1 Tax=Channa striata TaxID=64152 RepID=A0AA88MKR0_CHASR|nr:hypothetical protein Q5P01_013581 [Channa striata]
MRRRLVQIFGFLISTLGWVLVLCTLAMDYWRITQLGGQGGSFVIKVIWFWSSLWKDCSTDSTSVSNCKDFPTFWSVTPFIHGVRGLLMCGLIFGFVGAVLCFVGMECTYIGGTDKTKDKLLLAGAVFHFAGGVSDITAYSLYTGRIIRTNFGTVVPGILQYDIGVPIFLGLVGSFFIILGAVLYAVTVFKVICPESKVVYASHGGTYMAPRSRRRTLYTGSYKRSRHYGSYVDSGRSSSSRISSLSQTTEIKMSERDAFV